MTRYHTLFRSPVDGLTRYDHLVFYSDAATEAPFEYGYSAEYFAEHSEHVTLEGEEGAP